MSILHAIILGIIQGLTEFLPVSSSGHMMLFAKLFDVESSLAFELTLHLATLLAVVFYMRHQVLAVIKRPLSRQSLLIILASIPTAVIVFLLRSVVGSLGGILLPYFFVVTAILLLLSGLAAEKRPALVGIERKMSVIDALIIGSVQGLAAFPGLSRSGSTISTGVLLGNKKEDSAAFSFLLSIPVIVGSAIFEIAGGGLSGTPVLPLVAGFLAAFVFGVLAIKFMFKLLRYSFDYFAIYLLALSIFLFINQLFLHWF